jgi:Na+/proline symporter
LFSLVKKEVYPYRRAALWSILTGFVVNVLLFVWGVLLPEQFEPKNSFVPAFVVATLVLAGGVLMKKK